jgi:hypothetical protein
LSPAGFSAILHRKCAVRNVTFERPEDFFPRTILLSVEETWDHWLGPLVPDLPTFPVVLQELRPLVINLLRRR